MGDNSLFPVTVREETRTYRLSNKGCTYKLSISTEMPNEIGFDLEARSKLLGRRRARNFRLGLDQAAIVSRALLDLASGAYVENRSFSFVWESDDVTLDIGKNPPDEVALRINEQSVWGDKSVVLPLGQHARMLGEALRDLIQITQGEA